MSQRPHRKLIVWQKAMDFVETVYHVTGRFPHEEQFGLVAQLRRAAVSVASNIAEGAARQTMKETLQALYIARGSISELDTQLEIAHRLRFLSEAQWIELLGPLDDMSRLLQGLISSKKRPSISQSLNHSITQSLR